MMYTRQELDVIERELVRQRERLIRQLERFHETSRAADDIDAFSFHMADEGTDAMGREQAAMLASDEGRRLQTVDAALRRLYREPDTFGTCVGCGGPIGFARLEALPHAERCIECQNGQETGRPRE